MLNVLIGVFGITSSSGSTRSAASTGRGFARNAAGRAARAAASRKR